MTTRLTKAKRLAEAFDILGVTPEEVAATGNIIKQLQVITQGVGGAIKILRDSDNPDAKRFLEYYDQGNLQDYHRKVLPIEAFCMISGMTPAHLLGVVVEAATIQGAQLGSLRAAVEFPNIVKKSVELAKTKEGVSDREFQLKHAGFLPMPKGSQTNILVHATARTGSPAQEQPAMAPSPEDTFRRLTDRFHGQKVLDSKEPMKSLPDRSADLEAVPVYSRPDFSHAEQE
jgi:hypothetical protein